MPKAPGCPFGRDAELTQRLAATAPAIEQAHTATAATFALTRWNVHETPGITRCPHCRDAFR